MKFLISIILCVSLNADVPKDKVLHAGVGLGIYIGCLVIYKDRTSCLIPVILAGVGKELYDYKHPENHTADVADALATISIPMGTWVIYKF